jgi:hypothetical protein
MRAEAAGCDKSRASHQGLADGYAGLIAAKRAEREPLPTEAA